MSIRFLNNIKNWKAPNLKKVAFSALFASTLAFGFTTNPTAANEGLTTVYYVYLNKDYIGTVSNKNVVNEVVEYKLEELKKSYQKFDITVGSDISFIPEQVFRSTANDQSVVEKLQEELKPAVEAAAVVIGDAPAVYLKNEELAKQVVEELKLQYVSKDQLTDVEARQKMPNISLPPLKEDESRLLDVYFTKNVTTKEARISPDQIISVPKALKLIKKGTLEEVKYEVQEGDVLGSIANGHNLTLEQMLNINPHLNEDSVIKIGDEVNVTVPTPLVRVMVDREVSLKEEIPYEIEVEETSKMYKGDTKVKQQGQEGLRAVTYVVSKQNGTIVKKETINEEVLVKPIKKIVLKGTKVIPSRGEGNFVWPTAGGYVSSQMGYRWSRMHKGIDIARPSDLTIKTVDNGVVVFAGWDGGYGNKIIVDHQNGYRTIYAHLSSINVNVGQTVPRGSKIGNMGSTGDSTGVHLHFEVYKNGNLVNPLTILR
jgi:murein DD-endopeptidase MepM/ murein hydrolase activator NlpD